MSPTASTLHSEPLVTILPAPEPLPLPPLDASVTQQHTEPDLTSWTPSCEYHSALCVCLRLCVCVRVCLCLCCLDRFRCYIRPACQYGLGLAAGPCPLLLHYQPRRLGPGLSCLVLRAVVEAQLSRFSNSSVL